MSAYERLEIKEFILDANLYLITYSFHMINAVTCFLYFIICWIYTQEGLRVEYMIVITLIFISMMIFSVLGYRTISQQKKYISRLDNVFKNEEK